MKHALATSLLLVLFASNAFALPSDEPMQLLGELKETRQALQP
ncbi:hypothetical protein P8H27_18650 [Pseudomonas sp. sp1636]|nr:hypothetical protein [Pseudomonas sp. sp1636]MDM8350899.1 hypothetical protein [Pseudomonas sp. sp1636]